MGSCYSDQAHSAHRVTSSDDKPPVYMPTTMSTAAATSKPSHQSGFGFRRPPKKSTPTKLSQNSNEQSGGGLGQDERGGGIKKATGETDSLPSMSNSPPSRPKSYAATTSTTTQSTSRKALPRPKSAIVKPSRFGFQPTTKSSKEDLKRSSESVLSASKKQSSASTPSVNSDYLPKGTVIKHASFKPSTSSGSWRMIDDESRSTSTKSSLSTSVKSAKNTDNKSKMQGTVTPAKSIDSKRGASHGKTDTSSVVPSVGGNSSTSHTVPQRNKDAPKSSSMIGLRPQTKLRGPLAKFAANHYGSVKSTNHNVAGSCKKPNPSGHNGRGWVKASSTTAADTVVDGSCTAKSVSQCKNPDVDVTDSRVPSVSSSVKSERSGSAGSRTISCESVGSMDEAPSNRFMITYVKHEEVTPSVETHMSSETNKQSSKDKSPNKKKTPSEDSKSSGKSGHKTGFSLPNFLKRSRSSDKASKKKSLSKDERKSEDVPDTPECDDVFDHSIPPIRNKSQDSTVPLAMIESLETTSITSDDLMLDFEMTLDDDLPYEEKDAPRSRSNSLRYRRQRPRSRSRERVDNNERKGGQKRKDSDAQVRGDDGRSRKNSERADGGSVEFIEIQTEVALEELATLVHAPPLSASRNPRLSHAGRPNSFPGPRQSIHRSISLDIESPLASSPVDVVGSASTLPRLKPPRQGSSVTDDEQVVLDGDTYRMILSDITMYKTALLKLKRLMQEGDIGTPWKNGMVTSHPNSPCWEEGYKPMDITTPSPTDKHMLTELVQENGDLKQQLEACRHQLAEQDKSIKLLQHQMTKYECGHLGPGGRSYKNTAVQTDKRHSVGLANKYNRQGSRAASASNSSNNSSNKPLTTHNTAVQSQTQYSTRNPLASTDISGQQLDDSHDTMTIPVFSSVPDLDNNPGNSTGDPLLNGNQFNSEWSDDPLPMENILDSLPSKSPLDPTSITNNNIKKPSSLETPDDCNHKGLIDEQVVPNHNVPGDTSDVDVHRCVNERTISRGIPRPSHVPKPRYSRLVAPKGFKSNVRL